MNATTSDDFPGTTEIAARLLEQKRDELRDIAEDEADYRRLCREAGISPV